MLDSLAARLRCLPLFDHAAKILFTCIVHLIRNSLAFVSWKDRKKVMPDLRAIYRGETAGAALASGLPPISGPALKLEFGAV